MKQTISLNLLFTLNTLLWCLSTASVAATVEIGDVRNLDARVSVVDGQHRTDRTIFTGDAIRVNIDVDDLFNEDPINGSTLESVGAYDLSLSYDPNVLSYQGDPVRTRIVHGPVFRPSLLDLDAREPGTIRLQEVLLNELALAVGVVSSPGPHHLAGLNFDAIAAGTSPLELTVHSIANGPGDLLDVDTRGGQVKVVPIPAAVWLFGSALTGLLMFRRRPQAG